MLDTYRELLDLLAATPTQLKDAAAQAGAPPAGEGSAAQVLAHMAASEQLWLDMLNAMLRERDALLGSSGQHIEEMQDWSARPLDETYAVIFIDAIVVKVRDAGSDRIRNERSHGAVRWLRDLGGDRHRTQDWPPSPFEPMRSSVTATYAYDPYHPGLQRRRPDDLRDSRRWARSASVRTGRPGRRRGARRRRRRPSAPARSVTRCAGRHPGSAPSRAPSGR